MEDDSKYRCCISDCASHVFQNGKRFFKFPVDETSCYQMLAYINRLDIASLSPDYLRENFFLCSDHLDEDHNLEEVNFVFLQNVFKCDFCGNCFVNQDLLFDHCSKGCPALKIKEEKRDTHCVTCENCNQVFSTIEELTSHFENALCPGLSLTESIKPYFKREASSTDFIHFKKMKPKVISCPKCPKKFANPNGLKNHLKIHDNIRPHKCAECGKTFTVMSCLKTHLNTIHSNKKYECSICNKKYQSENYLKTHLRIHKGEKYFQCGNCSKKFVDSQALKLHMRIHSGEKPYKCNVCDKCFTQQSHLKTHKRLHTDERPFQCKECGKSFRQLSNVKEHERVHRKQIS